MPSPSVSSSTSSLIPDTKNGSNGSKQYHESYGKRKHNEYDDDREYLNPSVNEMTIRKHNKPAQPSSTVTTDNDVSEMDRKGLVYYKQRFPKCSRCR